MFVVPALTSVPEKRPLPAPERIRKRLASVGVTTPESVRLPPLTRNSVEPPPEVSVMLPAIVLLPATL